MIFAVGAFPGFACYDFGEGFSSLDNVVFPSSRTEHISSLLGARNLSKDLAIVSSGASSRGPIVAVSTVPPSVGGVDGQFSILQICICDEGVDEVLDRPRILPMSDPDGMLRSVKLACSRPSSTGEEVDETSDEPSLIVAASATRMVRIYDAMTGSLVSKIDSVDVVQFPRSIHCFSPAMSGDREVLIGGLELMRSYVPVLRFNLNRGEVVARYDPCSQDPIQISAIAASPKRSIFLAATPGRMIYGYDLRQTGRVRRSVMQFNSGFMNSAMVKSPVSEHEFVVAGDTGGTVVVASIDLRKPSRGYDSKCPMRVLLRHEKVSRGECFCLDWSLVGGSDPLLVAVSGLTVIVCRHRDGKLLGTRKLPGKGSACCVLPAREEHDAGLVEERVSFVMEAPCLQYLLSLSIRTLNGALLGVRWAVEEY